MSAPTGPRKQHQRTRPLRYFTAILGALFMFVATFILTGVVIAFLPPVFRTPVSLGVFETNNVLGLLLAGLAATVSFRATLRRARAAYAKK